MLLIVNGFAARYLRLHAVGGTKRLNAYDKMTVEFHFYFLSCIGRTISLLCDLRPKTPSESQKQDKIRQKNNTR